MAKEFCPKCGAELIPNAIFCTACGAGIEHLPEEPTPAKAPKEERRLCCSECGAELASGTKFCTECGAPVQSAAAARVKGRCPECGAEIYADERICPNCGFQPNYSPAGAAVPINAQATATAAVSKKSPVRYIIIAASAALAVLAVVLVILLFIVPKNVQDMQYDFSGFRGVYNGTAAHSVPAGEGTWIYSDDGVKISAKGEWKNGNLYDGKITLAYKGETVGTVDYSEGKWDKADYEAFCEAADSVNLADALKQ